MSDAQQIVGLSQRLGRLEQLIDHLYRHLGIDQPPRPDPNVDVSPRVMELIRAGNAIGAIKQLRDETGCDLATAKERVDVLGGAN